MSSDKLSRWSGFAAVLAPLFLLSFSSHTFWAYIGRARQSLGIADNTYIHPFVAAVGLIATALVLATLYQRLPQQTQPGSTWLLRGGIAGAVLGLVGVLGFFFPTQGWMFAGIGIGLLLILLALTGMGYFAWKQKVLGAASFAPLAIVITTLSLALTANFDGPTPTDSPLNQLFAILNVLSWLLLAAGLLGTGDDDQKQPVTA